MEEEIGPEAVLIHETVQSTDRQTPERHDPPRWHLIHADRALTWCGLDIGYGNLRRLWSETPAPQRCQICVGRLRGAPAPA